MGEGKKPYTKRLQKLANKRLSRSKVMLDYDYGAAHPALHINKRNHIMSKNTNLFFFNAAGVALLSVLQNEALGELQAAAAQRSNGVLPVSVINGTPGGEPGYKLNVINGLIRRNLLVECFRNNKLIGYRLNKRQEYKLLTRNHREGSRAWKMANGLPLEEVAPAPVEAPRKRRSKAAEQAPAPVAEAPRRRRRAASEQAAA